MARSAKKISSFEKTKYPKSDLKTDPRKIYRSRNPCFEHFFQVSWKSPDIWTGLSLVFPRVLSAVIKLQYFGENQTHTQTNNPILKLPNVKSASRNYFQLFWKLQVLKKFQRSIVTFFLDFVSLRFEAEKELSFSKKQIYRFTYTRALSIWLYFQLMPLQTNEW